MKKLLLTFTLVFAFVVMASPLAAQQTNPGEPGGDPQMGGDPPLGGGAPVGGGLFILLGLSAVYGGKKIYSLFNNNNNKKEN